MLDLQGLHVRAALFNSIREFFSERGFLEVDTPIRQPVIIPECNIVPITAEGQYLQTSPELCMKRLLAAGCTNIFQLCHCFRKNERGRNHLEEFTMLEWYRRGENYQKLMIDCTELLEYVAGMVAEAVAGTTLYSRAVEKSREILTRPAEKLTVAQAFERYAPISLANALAEKCFDEVLVEHIEPYLGLEQPLFLMDYPRELASLASVSQEDQAVAERFELYVSGSELANGFTELTDPVEQRERFSEELRAIDIAQGTAPQMPERFLADLSHLDSGAGIAFGVDRLLMQLLDCDSIDDVVSFCPDDFL